MKKFLAIVLSLTFIVCSLGISVSAEAADVDSYRTIGEDDAGIKYYTGLDFNDANNVWAKFDETTNTWVKSGVEGNMYTDGENYTYGTYNKETQMYSILEDGKFVEYTKDAFEDPNGKYGAYYSEPSKTYLTTLNSSTDSSIKGIDWSISDDGEFMTMVANSSNTHPGLFFMIDNEMNEIQVGDEAKNQPEYVAIRYRNWSTASVMSFGFVTKSTNGGNGFMSRTTTDMETVANSGEWVTKVFSMKELNGAMGHKDNNGGDGWNGIIRMFAVFPFGYSKTDGTGAYESATMDIDYIVIGSEDFVKNYKSELQRQEELVSSIKLVKAPTKTTYYVGDVVDLEGLQIEATYANGSTEIISNCSGVKYDFTQASDKSTVTLKYGSNTTPVTYDVKVIGIESVEATGLPENTTYVAGKIAKDGLTASDIKGLELKITYNDGTTKEGYIPSIKNVSISDTTVGDQIVTVNYYGSKTTYKVNLITVVDIKVDEITDALHYGDEIKADSLNITVVYSDGSEKTLSDSGFADQLKAIEANTKVIGEITFDVVLENEAYNFSVTTSVKATVGAPKELVIATTPTKTEYDPEEKLDTTGLVVKYVYEDGTEVVVDEADYKTRYDFSEPGTKTVTVLSNELTASFDVLVKGTTSTTAPQQSTTAPKPGKDDKNGCKSLIGTSSLVVIAAVSVAGAMIIKKKEN